MLQFKGYLFSKKIDLFFLFLPIWTTWLVVFVLPDSILESKTPLIIWVIVVLGIDVSHVWSTIFRTYLDKDEFQNHKKLLIFSPFIVFVLVMITSYFGEYLFWKTLAYFALFHFMKQQYGFLALYITKSKDSKKKYLKDKWIIYLSMLYPIFYWHLHQNRNFDWFVDNDFSFPLAINLPHFDLTFMILNCCYWLIITAWLLEEIIASISQKTELNLGKILWLISTAFNWYLGIVYFNSDLVFTITNVIAHGIPYMVLIFIYKAQKDIALETNSVFTRNILIGISFFMGTIFILGFVEEYCWDWFINRSKYSFFENILKYPSDIIRNKYARMAIIAFLSIPQITHYIIDGFIWKKNDRNPYLKFLFKK